MGMLDWIKDVGGLLLGGAQTAQNAHAQREANKTNLKLQREQQAWEENMSSTAIQRRQKDIIAAGGNPALAFTGGGEASTPTVAPARVEAEKLDFTNLQTALLQREQMKQMRETTRLTAAKAGQEEETLHWMKRPGTGGQNRFQSRMDIEDLHRRIKMETDSYTRDMTATRRDLFERAQRAALQQAEVMAEKGKLELDQIKSVIDDFGLGAQDKANLLQSVMKIIIPLFKD